MTQTSFNCGEYQITSYGNGTAYNITKGHQSVWVQTEEAMQIQWESHDFTDTSALDDLFLNYFSS